ncbi:hypothetical protein [Streptomyces sp. H39-S7]|uniref:hypothetical protein n=1 Tax=Streptomyces sp. H39-S7 TaxID=3004357 RepID=UPI0022AE7E98|nr:hypothetical protein [Streptomyces sp. H39-S7]MCZ4121775.1 hypothetical protein [Streptomyces sp. H39-S7]
MTGALPGRLARLPIQVSPRLGEGTDSFIRRLARANHLRPSYLHGFLCGPPFWFGKPRVERLADITGRTTSNLEQALFDVSTARLRYRTGPGQAHLAHRQPDLYIQLQNAARDEGLTIRNLAIRHGIPRWLIRNALVSFKPLPRELPARQAPVTRPIAPLIDSMMHAGLGAREIWTMLMDEHNTSVSYGTLNLYISKRRRNAEWQSEHFRIQRRAVLRTQNVSPKAVRPSQRS